MLAANSHPSNQEIRGELKIKKTDGAQFYKNSKDGDIILEVLIKV